jgi:hypothetical protein
VPDRAMAGDVRTMDGTMKNSAWDGLKLVED